MGKNKKCVCVCVCVCVCLNGFCKNVQQAAMVITITYTYLFYMWAVYSPGSDVSAVDLPTVLYVQYYI